MIWYFDLDGTVIDNIKKYYEAWYAFAKRKGFKWADQDFSKYTFQQIFKPTEEVSVEEFETCAEFADFYIEDMFTGAEKVIERLKEMGDTIIFLTSRNPEYKVMITPKIRSLLGLEDYPEITHVSLRKITSKYLTSRGFGGDALIFAEDKVKVVKAGPENCVCVDDSPEKISKYIDAGICCCIVEAEYNRGCKDNRAIRFNDYSSLIELRGFILNWVAGNKTDECAFLKEQYEAERKKRSHLESSNLLLTKENAKLTARVSELARENELLAEELRKYKTMERYAKLRKKGNAPVQSCWTEECTSILKTLFPECYLPFSELFKGDKKTRDVLGDMVFLGRCMPFSSASKALFEMLGNQASSVEVLSNNKRYNLNEEMIDVLKKVIKALSDAGLKYCVAGESALLMYGFSANPGPVTIYVRKCDLDKVKGCLNDILNVDFSVRHDTEKAANIIEFGLDNVRVQITTGLRVFIDDNVIDNEFTDSSLVVFTEGIAVQHPAYLKRDAELLGDEQFMRKVNILNTV